MSDNGRVSGPRDEYVNRLERRQSTHLKYSQVDARLSYFRLLAFAVLAAFAILAWQGTLTWGWCLGPCLVFAWLVHRHDRVIRARDVAARAVQFYERGLARLDDRWTGRGEQGDRFIDPSHPYATDIDLFGPGSLFELLSIARTRSGENTLAAWLKFPATPGVIGERHAAVDDLLKRLDLREAVWLAGSEVRVGVDGEALVAWADAAPRLTPFWLRGVAMLLAAMAVATFVLWMRTGRLAPLLLVLAIEGLLFFIYRSRIQQVLHSAGGWSRDLDLLAHVVARLEKESFSAPLLVGLRKRLDAAGTAPATAIRVLHRLAEMHDWQHNLIFATIAMPLLWDVQIAFAMERWRRRYGTHVRHWLDSVGEFEALSSLAAYSYEHPADRFPELVDTPAAIFDGVAMGHPLLPQARMVRNDVTLDGPTRLLLISGSNMSGKSTLLRTVGVNAVLAQAGAPVRAASLRLSPLAVGATLRIQDSLQEGRSRFYAEITRVRELADLALGRPPLLFLLDELFHGTNSHDRLVGAAGVLKTLVARGAIGLVTTHDLALTAVADDLALQAVNVHFDDRFEAGEIRFDYRMKPGPVTRSNAIALMRAVGLEVGEG